MNELQHLRGRRSALPSPTRGRSDDPRPSDPEAVALISRVQRAFQAEGVAHLPALAQHLLDIALDELHLIGCCLFVVDEPARQLIPYAHARTERFPPQALPFLDPPPEHHGFDLGAPHNLTARSARERRTLTSSDYRDFLLPPDSSPGAASLPPAPGLGMAASVPARLDDRVVAVLLVAVGERELAPPRMRLLELFADQGAISIHNAQSHDAVQQALRRETELCLKLRAADRMKGDLLLMAGHELRTPLAAVRYGLEFFASRPSVLAALPEGDGDLPRDLLAQINQLDGMVEHLCQTLRSLHQRLEISGRPLRVDLLLREILLRRAREFRRQRIDIQLDDETEAAPATVLADAAQLRYALWELITNAVKHGGSGATVAIGLRVAEQAEKPRLRIDIDNTGRGISAEARARLFREPAAPADELEHRVVPGMGLGLYLVNKIVDLHRGSIEVQSDGTSQTRFTLFFPILEEAFGDEVHEG